MRLSLVDQLENVDGADLAEIERIKTENYLLYFSHGDLTLIASKGTKAFLLVFTTQLILWLGYAAVLVWTSSLLLLAPPPPSPPVPAVPEPEPEPVDTPPYPEPWCLNGVWAPALRPEMVRRPSRPPGRAAAAARR